MPIELSTPDVHGLDEAVATLAQWQADGVPWQLHPGDLGWFCRFGTERAATAVRVWRREGELLALGLLDGEDLLRMTLAPGRHRDEELSRAVADDLCDPGRGVLPTGTVYVEAPEDALLQDLLAERGWPTDEPWAPLRRDLSGPVPDPGLRVEQVGPEQAGTWTEVLRSAFDGSTAHEQRWHAMAAGTAYRSARSLLGRDDDGEAVAAVVVWGAGPGRPGLIEPMGVHQDHRGRGHGRAITLAAAAALQDMRASAALVYTPSRNVGAVATYRAAGFESLPEIRDRRRDG